MVSDPIADLIIRMQNAAAIGKENLSVPFSALKMAVLEKLKERGYIKYAQIKGKKVQKTIEIGLLYDKQKNPRITGVARVSKPSRRMYVKSTELYPVKYGKGSLILSTPKGILSDDEARKSKTGGEALFKIW